MPIERFEPTNYEETGKLLKKWSEVPETRPTVMFSDKAEQLQEFKDQAVLTGLDIPGRITEVQFIEQEEHVLRILLPLRTMIKESIEELEAGGDYSVPPFYEKLAFRDPANIEEENKIKFLMSRIGDYSFGSCM